MRATPQRALNDTFDSGNALRKVINAAREVPNVSPHVTPDGDDASYHRGPYSKDSNQLRRHMRFLNSREVSVPLG